MILLLVTLGALLFFWSQIPTTSIRARSTVLQVGLAIPLVVAVRRK
ncbi:MAG: hypothetical protein R2855_04620 [Thermomicrobiales bacterium]